MGGRAFRRTCDICGRVGGGHMTMCDRYEKPPVIDLMKVLGDSLAKPDHVPESPRDWQAIYPGIAQSGELVMCDWIEEVLRDA